MTGRLGVRGLATPHPVGASLPGLYEDDALAGIFAAAFDGMLAPVQSTLDCLGAYVDPGQAPADFVDWLATWVAAPVDPRMPLLRRRLLVGATGDLQRARGTRAGLVQLLQIALGATEVDVEGGGGTWWSAEPRAVVPEAMRPVVVRVTLPIPPPVSEDDVERVERLLTTAVPAHLPFRVEVSARGAVP